MKKFLLMMLFALLLIPASLFAQEQENAKYKFGLTFPDIGVIWNISDHVSLLSGFDFGHAWGGSESSSTRTTSDSVSVCANLRFYVSEWNKLRLYLSPKYKYSWLQTDTEFSLALCANNGETPYPCYISVEGRDEKEDGKQSNDCEGSRGGDPDDEWRRA
jgi:hypothetical protein